MSLRNTITLVLELDVEGEQEQDFRDAKSALESNIRVVVGDLSNHASIHNWDMKFKLDRPIAAKKYRFLVGAHEPRTSCTVMASTEEGAFATARQEMDRRYNERGFEPPVAHDMELVEVDGKAVDRG